MGSFPWWRSNLRARRGQAVVLGSVVALLVAFAALLPLLTTSIARALVDDHVRALGSLGRTIDARAMSGTDGIVPLSRVEPVLGDQWTGLSGPATGQLRMDADSGSNSTDHGTVLWRDGMCSHLRFTGGHCPTGGREVAISAASAEVLHLAVGGELTILNGQAGSSVEPTPPNSARLRVVGIFAQPPGDDYWRGIDIASVPSRVNPQGETGRFHTWLVDRSLFTGAGAPPWGEVETSVARQLSPSVFRYDDLPAAVAALKRTNALATADASHPIQVTEQVSTLDEQVHRDLDQIRLIAPLLLLQLLVLQAILAWIVLRSFVVARRQEVALLRLRTPGRAGARRLLLGELLPPLLAGLPAGLALGYALDWVSRHTWLPHHTLGGWSWTALGAAVLATVLCVAAALLLTRRTVRAPVATLLRSVAPRTRRWSVSPLEAILIAAGIGLMVAVWSGTLTGAPVLLTPLVMAVAVGLVTGGLLVPLGNALARRLLRRGSVAVLLGTTALSRRPSTRQAVLAVTAAGAMLTFSVATLALGQSNREALAQVESGAPVLLQAIDASGTLPISTLRDVVLRVDPTGAHLTPVYRIRSAGDGPVTIAGDPNALRHIALRPEGVDPWSLLLQAKATAGAIPAVTASSSPASTDQEFQASALTDLLRTFRLVGTVPYIAGGEAHAFVAPIAPMLGQMDRTDLYIPEVWSDGTRPDLEQQVTRQLRAAGFRSVTTQRASTARGALDSSASAYGLQLGLVVALGALLVAVLVLVAVQQSQAGVRRGDQQAVRRAGVPAGVVRRAALVEALLAASPVLLGGLVGYVGALLSAPHVPWFADPPDFDVTTSVPPVGLPLIVLVLGAVVVLATALRVLPRGGHRG